MSDYRGELFPIFSEIQEAVNAGKGSAEGISKVVAFYGNSPNNIKW